MLDEQMLKATLTYLKKRALANSDPGLYIDLVIDDQENPAYAKLISEIADNDFSSFAAKHDPDIEKPQYRQFFSVIYNGLRSVIVRSDSMAAAGGRKAGNETNASSNGTAGKGSKK